MNESEQVQKAIQLLAERCPRLVRLCYWAGTAAIALEELAHRRSFDLDFHTRRALQDVRPILAELQAAFPGNVEILQAPDEFGSGFRALLCLPEGVKIPLEVLSNFEDVPAAEIIASRTVPAVKRVTVRRYLADKVQCIAERSEARDLVDIGAVLSQHPELASLARTLLGGQDALLLVERLQSWSDEALEKDLAAYSDVDPGLAREVRDLLLEWLRNDQS